MVPKVVTIIDVPFGAKNIKVHCSVQGVTEQIITKAVIPASEPIPLLSETSTSNEIVIDETVYSSTELYRLAVI